MTRPLAVLLLTLLIAACATTHPPARQPAAAPDPGRSLAAKVTADGMFVHLRALQEIANANKGNRTTGTPGYDASVDYVVKALRGKGFDVSTPQFERMRNVSEGKPTLTVGGRSFPVDQASLLVRTPPGGLTGQVVRPTQAAGCGAGDYAAALPKGAIAVVDDSRCSVVDKQNAAVGRGAAAVIVISQPSGQGAPPTLFNPGYYNQLTVPVAVVGANGAAALKGSTASVRLVLDAENVRVVSRNVLAQTKTGSANEVVMVGTHLDSPAESPGINNAGSGVAAVLETALQLGPLPPVANAVRFAFWGAAENGLNGSMDYVFSLDNNALNDIALYLNFDMLGSPNPGFFTDDGDQSGPAGPGVAASDIPEGSAGIERTLAGYLNLAGKRPADMPVNTRTDYHPFLVAGVPVGGMNTGASQTKTTVQARLWGGQPGAAFDPNYQGPRDTVDEINRDALAVMGSGVAFAVGTYADSIGGVNGVTPHDKRHRTRVS
ncbi:peptidase M28 [Mycobacterium paragordonae]|uniref:Peptidase M28 n=1 Tax=Mycobacterium paragordonae TaxID=1389713 RepID=A0ABQ1BY15_9MYCO|nr:MULTISPECIES: M28 family peptidase [Mycobacterium]AYE94079.1 peptidase M28 [Mycobacterium paragordonae]OBK54286.1 peptidase M28 [Mycobacterium gordonae]TDL00413.1 M28 family peptidase [Mycobacterium paragordonae]GFG77011.1 peptidase M28 [Mycobacterium paragordonae]